MLSSTQFWREYFKNPSSFSSMIVYVVIAVFATYLYVLGPFISIGVTGVVYLLIKNKTIDKMRFTSVVLLNLLGVVLLVFLRGVQVRLNYTY